MLQSLFIDFYGYVKISGGKRDTAAPSFSKSFLEGATHQVLLFLFSSTTPPAQPLQKQPIKTSSTIQEEMGPTVSNRRKEHDSSKRALLTEPEHTNASLQVGGHYDGDARSWPSIPSTYSQKHNSKSQYLVLKYQTKFKTLSS